MAPARARALAVSLALAALLGGCSSGDEGEGDASGRSDKGGIAEDRAHLPLTGQESDAVPDRPALFVKVDNTANARPQVGLGKADLIVEELAEGGLTRLAVGYQSRLPETVGPVRSLRTSDIGIVGPSKGWLAASGAARVALDKVTGAGINTALPPTPGFTRDSGRKAPYNLMLDPQKLLSSVDKDLAVPPDYLAWAEPGASPGGKAVNQATVTFSPASTTRWRWDGKAWRRDRELAAAGDAFAPDNVLIVRVTTRDAGYHDPAGNRVPETVLTGEGKATLLLGGRAVAARWSKKSNADPLRFTTAAGEELKVPPGRTWIELVPEGGSVKLGAG